MESHKQYEICYRYKGKARRFGQPDSCMSAADAWYYASLHAGAGLYEVALHDTAVAVRQIAERAGLSDVGFRELA